MKKQLIRLGYIVLLIALTTSGSLATACTEVMLKHQGSPIIARSFDWPDPRVFLVINPKNYARHAIGLPNGLTPLHWHAKYRSITFDMATKQGKLNSYAVAGGMNSQGLVASVLWLSASRYPKPNPKEKSLDNASMAQFVLDRYATVAQAVKGLKTINIVPVKYNGIKVKLHLALFDKAGHSAFIEFLQGKMHLTQGPTLTDHVITNSAFPAIAARYSSHPGEGLAGYGSAARYFKAAKWLNQQPHFFTTAQTINYGFSLLSAVEEPRGSADPTQWGVIYNPQTGTVYFSRAHKNSEIAIKLSSFSKQSKKLVFMSM